MAVKPVSVQKEYEKLKNVKPEDIEQIMNWLKTQPHLPSQYITELDVILAYHSCAYNIGVTKRVIDVNYTLKTLFPFYENRKMDQCLETAIKTWLIMPLRSFSKEGYTRIYCELLDPDPENFVYSDAVKVFFMMMDLWQYETGTSPGVVLIINLDQVTLAHISKVDLIVAQEFFYFLQEAMFVNLKEFHFINAPTFIDKLLAIIRPFMKDELLNVLKVHHIDGNTLDEYTSNEDLYEVTRATREVLKDNIYKRLKSNSKFFDEESMKRVDESKRFGGPKTMSSFFPSIVDNFKKLEID